MLGTSYHGPYHVLRHLFQPNASLFKFLKLRLLPSGYPCNNRAHIVSLMRYAYLKGHVRSGAGIVTEKGLGRWGTISLANDASDH